MTFQVSVSGRHFSGLCHGAMYARAVLTVQLPGMDREPPKINATFDDFDLWIQYPRVQALSLIVLGQEIIPYRSG
jgi:hypothetical protein